MPASTIDSANPQLRPMPLTFKSSTTTVAYVLAISVVILWMGSSLRLATCW